MKTIVAYIFATLLSLILGIPLLVCFGAMLIYEPLLFLTIIGAYIIFIGGIWGFAYLATKNDP